MLRIFQRAADTCKYSRVDRSKIEDPRGWLPMRCVNMHGRLHARTRQKFVSWPSLKFSVFEREFRISAGLQTRFADFGISEMRCRARGMFITKFYYPHSPPRSTAQLYMTLRDAPYYNTTREQCVSLPYTAMLRSTLCSFHYAHA